MHVNAYTHKKETSNRQYKPAQTPHVIVARILLEIHWNVFGFSKLKNKREDA